MLLHQIIGREIADPFIELRRALQIGEQESQAGDLQALVDVERVGAIEIAKCLVREQAVRRQERSSPTQHGVQFVACDPHRRQHPPGGAVVEGQAQGARPHLDGLMLRVRFVEDQRQVLALLGRLALHVDELRRMGDRIEHDDELRRKLQGERRPFARRQLHGIENDFLDDLREVVGQVDARAPEELPFVVPHGKRVGIVARDFADAGGDRERHLDHLVQGGLIACAA